MLEDTKKNIKNEKEKIENIIHYRYGFMWKTTLEWLKKLYMILSHISNKKTCKLGDTIGFST